MIRFFWVSKKPIDLQKLDNSIEVYIRENAFLRHEAALVCEAAIECLRDTEQYKIGNPSYEFVTAELDRIIIKLYGRLNAKR